MITRMYIMEDVTPDRVSKAVKNLLQGYAEKEIKVQGVHIIFGNDGNANILFHVEAKEEKVTDFTVINTDFLNK